MADPVYDSEDGATDKQGTLPSEVANYWQTQIAYAERKVKAFRTRGDQIIRRYKNKRSTAVPTVTNVTVGQRRMNILYSNVQTMMPVLYANTPKPNVQRRNKDKNPAGRWAAIVLERTLANTLDMQDFDHVIEQDVESLLLPGYGCSMVEYVPQVEDDQMGWQEARLRYVSWRDQLTNPARYWQEVTWWAYVSYLTRREVRKAYGPKVAEQIVLDHKASKDADDSMSKATVWCIWDKTSQKVIHIATGYPEGPLGEYDAPVKFEGFFPIARPLVATTATDSTIPVPDFDQYQDQADEIDMYTQRIYVLGRSLRLRGLYPGDMQSVRQIMDNSSDADLIPVENWAMLGERGGANGLVVWFPIDQVAKVLIECHNNRDKAMQSMYEITGISDIIRGATDAQETLGAQQLKAQFSSVRTRDRQKDVQRYIRDILRHMSSVIGQHFTLEVLQKMSGANLLTNQQKQTIGQYQQFMAQYQQQAQMAQQQGMQPPPPPQIPQPTPEMMEAMEEPSWEDVLAILRDEKMRGFVIDIETDSTVEADQMAQQQKAEQFIAAISQFMVAWMPVLQLKPDLAPLAGELLMFGVRQFKAGQGVETELEEAVEKLTKEAEMASQQPQPNPELIKAQADAAQAQADAQQTQQDMVLQQQKHQDEMQIKQAEFTKDIETIKADFVADVAKHRMTLEHKTAEAHADRQHQAEQGDRDREHQAGLAKESNKNARTLARMKPDAKGANGEANDLQEVEDATPDEGSALADAIQKAAEASLALAQEVKQQGEEMKQGLGGLAQAILAPTRAVRDPQTNRIVGSHKVLN